MWIGSITEYEKILIIHMWYMYLEKSLYSDGCTKDENP